MPRSSPFAVLLLTALVCSLAAAVPAQRSNTLVLVADDLGPDMIGAYHLGTHPAPTPNIDAMAKRGVLFRNAWANPLCSPTRACIMTGRYSFRTGVGYAIGGHRSGILRPEEYTIPEVLDLGHSGHAHALIGKWHLGGRPTAPNTAGWSHYAGVIGGQVNNYFDWYRTEDGKQGTCRVYCTTQQVDDALAWIKEQTGPWTCLLTFCAPHAAYHKPPPALTTYDLHDVVLEEHPGLIYRAMIEAMDTEIGRLLAELGPELEHTNVIFLGDNGTLFIGTEPPFDKDHAKGTPFEHGTAIPLIAAGPDVREPGREVEAMVDVVDVFGTMLDLAGVDARATVPPWVALDSVSFAPYLRDPKQAPQRHFLFAEQFKGGSYAAAQNNGFATVRDQRYHLIRSYDEGEHEDALYDRQVDPNEQHDLMQGALTDEQRQHYDALVAYLERLRHPLGVTYAHGVACQGSHGPAHIGARGKPTPGGSLQILLRSAPPSQPAVLLIAHERRPWKGPELPWQMPGAPPGCTVQVGWQGFVRTRTDATGTASLQIPIPPHPRLIGETFQMQWLLADPGVDAEQKVITSDALAAVVGF